MIINENGEIARFCFTKGNVLDVNELKMAERLSGMLVGDKGYISQELEKHLEKTLLEKRNITETVFSQLKNWGVVNTKIRSYCGWILNALSCLASYVIQPFKPHLRFSKNLLIRNSGYLHFSISCPSNCFSRYILYWHDVQSLKNSLFDKTYQNCLCSQELLWYNMKYIIFFFSIFCV